MFEKAAIQGRLGFVALFYSVRMNVKKVAHLDGSKLFRLLWIAFLRILHLLQLLNQVLLDFVEVLVRKLGVHQDKVYEALHWVVHQVVLF